MELGSLNPGGAGRGRADGAGLPSRGRAGPRLCALYIAAVSNTEFAFTMCMFVGERVAVGVGRRGRVLLVLVSRKKSLAFSFFLLK